MTPLRLYPLIVIAVAAAASVAIYLRRHRKTDAERERERRDFINRIGRITDGTVTDVQEFTADGHGQTDGRAVQLIIYSYDVAGVSYEASQDVSHLGQHIDLHTSQLGLPASVKYDPHNPGNSIVIAEGWSGLRG
jgi:hypothetical protein